MSKINIKTYDLPWKDTNWQFKEKHALRKNIFFFSFSSEDVVGEIQIEFGESLHTHSDPRVTSFN